MWSEIIEDFVLYSEAKKRGLEASLDEAKEYALWQKEMLLTEPLPVGATNVLDYVKGLGYTVDEYFEENIAEYQQMITLANLRSDFFNQFGKDIENMSFEEVDKEYEEFRLELLEKAELIYNK